MTTPVVTRSTTLPPGTPASTLPSLDGPIQAVVPAVNRSLKVLNRWFMVPALRLGLGPWIGTPVGGYVLLLRVRGRKSGLVRDVPLSYLVAEGSAWVMAGFGPRTAWFRNLQADPEVDAWLGGRVLRCRAEEVVDPGVRARIAPALTRATGAPGLLVGCNPWTAPDGRILELLAGVPLVRLTPVGGPIAAGPDDPGGHAWIWRQGLIAGAMVVLLAAARRH
jgi:deazaflavin-dependent oxidoreductase (nitroreductase family)